MGAPTEYYVDPSIAANSGTGTSGDPYGDLQYALDTVTRDATNGDQFNVKAGTDEVLTAALSLTSYGSSSYGHPLIIRGYTSASGDGGIGGISGNGTYADISTTNAVHFKDMHCHNSGSVDIVTLGAYSTVERCEFDNTSGSGVVTTSGSIRIASNNIHNIGTYGVSCSGTGDITVEYNYFANGTNTFTDAIRLASHGAVAWGNVISIGGASNGINNTTYQNNAEFNSILSASGTGVGLLAGSNGLHTFLNNAIEGFSGTGGVGIKSTSGQDIHLYGGNAVYNCTTAYSIASDVFIDLGDNESLGASPFDKSGSDTFANRFTYFAPADTGNVQGGAYPSGARRDKGAVQHADPVGGIIAIQRPIIL